jgi:hypothetical protein
MELKMVGISIGVLDYHYGGSVVGSILRGIKYESYQFPYYGTTQKFL